MNQDAHRPEVLLNRREVLRLASAGTFLVITGCTPLGRDLSSGAMAPDPTPTTAVPPAPPPATPQVTPTAARTAPPVPQEFGIDSDIVLTPNEQFYTVSYMPGDPLEVDAATWDLQVYGLVDNPITLDLDDIKAMPSIIEMRTLECIGNLPGGELISNAVWKGASFAAVLDMAGVRPEAIEVKMISADGYDTSIPVELAMHPRSLLAYEMNGEPLPFKNGYPLRCLWPGRYGQKQPKYLTRVELIADNYLGYWEAQGWSNEARIRPNSQIREPRSFITVPQEPLLISGFALSNESGVAGVDISTDNGENWSPAELVRAPEPFTPYVWTQWSHQWQPRGPGNHWILARVTDGSGEMQTRDEFTVGLSDVFPSGTKQMHAVQVKVEES